MPRIKGPHMTHAARMRTWLNSFTMLYVIYSLCTGQLTGTAAAICMGVFVVSGHVDQTEALEARVKELEDAREKDKQVRR